MLGIAHPRTDRKGFDALAGVEKGSLGQLEAFGQRLSG